MRLEDKIEEKGEFKFISAIEKEMVFKGSAIIVDGGKTEIILDIDDASEISNFFGKNFSLYANLNKFQHSIFTNCLIKSMPSFGKGEVKINVGASFLEIDNNIVSNIVNTLIEKDFPSLIGIKFSVDNIENWIPAHSSFKVEHLDGTKPLIVTYTPREPIIFYENSEFRVRLVFNYIIPGFPIIQDVTLSERAFFEIKKTNGNVCSQEDLFDYFYRIITLMYLYIGVPVSVKQVAVLFSKQGKNYWNPFFFQSHPYQEKISKLNWHEINIPFESVKYLDKNYQLVSKWYENFDRFLPSINLYISYLTTNNNTVENKFLWLAQAVEALHRRTSNLNRKMTFRQRVKDFIDPILDMLTGVSYEKYLPEEQVISEKNSLKDKLEVCTGKIVDFRNQLTHNDINSKKIDHKAALSLIALTSLLELILIVNLLKQCNLPDNIILGMLDEPHRHWFNLKRKTRHYILNYIETDILDL